MRAPQQGCIRNLGHPYQSIVFAERAMRIGVVAVFLLASSMQSFGQLTAKPIDKTKKNKAISLTDTIPPVPTAGTMGIKDVDPYVTKWTDWQQLTIAPLTPNNPITDFGTELCKGSPNFPDLCVTTARLYIVHIMDWESIPAEKKVGENTKTPQVQLK